MQTERLDKWIASQGRLSRKQVGELIRAGKVRVNGKSAVSPAQKIDEEADVEVGGERLILRRHLYLMMNKPGGVVSATSDKKEKTVLDLVPETLWRPGLFPAGRLDKDTEGFLLLTDDGAFAHRILAPTSHVPKTYYAKLDGALDAKAETEAFAAGMDLGGGDVCSPAELTVLRAQSPAEAEVTIYEGMFHQVKRMFAHCGVSVTYLKRTRIGSLDLDPTLAAGECRIILHNELHLIC
jgi:16S rRNA pseudouridine516 synthase